MKVFGPIFLAILSSLFIQKALCYGKVLHPSPVCHRKLDIGIVLDGSGSVKWRNWKIILKFVKSFINKFNVGEDGVHFGILRFSTRVYLDFKLYNKRYWRKDLLLKKIDRIRYPKGWTRTDLALRSAYRNFFCDYNCGKRKDAQQILLVLTDGKSNYRTTTIRKAAQPIKDAGVTIIAIGVANADKKELRDMATSNGNVFMLKKFNDLYKNIKKLTTMTCEAQVLRPAPVCRRKLDIGIVLDGSGSVKWRNWKIILKFVKSFINKFNVGEDGVHFGILRFSTRVYLDFKLSNKRYWRKDVLLNRINRIRYPKGWTRTDLALRSAYRNFFCDYNCGKRKDAQQILLVLTDGKSNYRTTTIRKAAQPIKDAGVTIIAIGVANADKKELRDMASSNENVFMLRKFKDLYKNIKKLTTMTCEAKKKVDGNWGKWSSWAGCSKTCGGGLRKRVRSCNNPAPANGGKSCTGRSFEQEKCNENPCPIDGKFGKWSSWAGCSKTCGGGLRKRVRSCNNPAPANGGKSCAGRSVEQEKCNENPCPIDGKFGKWSSWAACSKTCGGGLRKRVRSCNNPAPANGGKTCAGRSFEQEKCNEKACQTVCHQKLDVGIVLDGSTSVTIENWKITLEFVKSFINLFNVGEDGSHFGVLRFANEAYLDFKISDKRYWRKDTLLNKINSIEYPYGMTRTDLALESAHKNFFCDQNCGKRKGVPQVLLVLTDGKSSDYGTTVKEAAQPLKDAGVTIIAVGIGEADRSELNDMASNSQNVFLLRQFKDLNAYIKQLLAMTCKVARKE